MEDVLHGTGAAKAIISQRIEVREWEVMQAGSDTILDCPTVI